MQASVRVKEWYPPGHVRAPFYLRGKCGKIERSLGQFGNPEQQAYGLKGDLKELLRVRFTMAEVWGTECESPDDTIEAEIYEHWLEPTNAP